MALGSGSGLELLLPACPPCVAIIRVSTVLADSTWLGVGVRVRIRVRAWVRVPRSTLTRSRVSSSCAGFLVRVRVGVRVKVRVRAEVRVSLEQRHQL